MPLEPDAHDPVEPLKFVLDTSVTLSFYFKDELTAQSVRFESLIPQATVYVPVVWSYEVANAIVMGERRNRSTQIQAADFLAILMRMGIQEDRLPLDQIWDELIAMARRFSLTTYDAAYLELARRKRAPLATLDTVLKRAARKAGIPLFAP